MEEELKGIKIELDYITPTGEKTIKCFSVKTTKLKDVGIKMFHSCTRRYEISFTITLPQHIYDGLINQTVPKSGTLDYKTIHYTKDNLTKSITRFTLHQVCDDYNEKLAQYLWLKGIQNKQLQKVIYYNFNAISAQQYCQRKGNKLGDKNLLQYFYGIGYVSHENDQLVRYNEDKIIITDDEYNKASYTEWTEERELYFKSIKETFDKIVANVILFNRHLTIEKKIDDIIRQQATPLLHQ
jgi:hypothetical protein